MSGHADTFHIDANLFHLVASGDLDRVCIWFYEHFKYPVTVIDSSFKHVSSAPAHRLIDDPYWDGVQTEGGIPAKEMASTYRYQYVEAMLRSNDVTVIDWGDVKYPNINGVLQWNKSVFGYSVVIYTDDHYSLEKAMQISRLFNKCALATLQSSRSSMPKDASFIQYVFSSELMSGKLTSAEDLAYWQELSGVKLSGRYAVMRCCTTQENAYRFDAELTQRRIRHLPPERRDNENFDFLLCGFGSQAELEKCIHSLPLPGRAALSDLFDDLLRIEDSCEQARLTSEITRGHELESAFYCDWQSEIMISLIRSNIHYDANCKHEIIRKLEQYDDIYGTDYTSSLFAYLENFCNILKAANQLDIHRNTLQYRLNKIDEICGCNLSDSQTQYELLVSSAVLLGK